VVEFFEGIHEALTVYVRALAWWHAVPKEPPSRNRRVPKQEPERLSRLDMRINAGGELDLPDIDPALTYLIGWLMEAGPMSAAGIGPVPLTWLDLDAWQRCTGVRVQPWEARLLRRLSGDYLDELNNAEAHDAPAPWIPESTVERRTKVATHIRNILRG